MTGIANDGGAVAAAVGDLGGGLEARDQPLVAIGGGVGEGAEGLGVLEQAADGMDPQVAQARVALAGEERLVVLPERQVGVHARAVVAEEGLGHERRGLACPPGDVADDVLGHHHLVGTFDERMGHQVDLALAAGGDLVEVGRRGDPALGHALGHLGAEVDQAVGRRAGKIAQARSLACNPGWAIPTRPRFHALRPNRRDRKPRARVWSNWTLSKTKNSSSGASKHSIGEPGIPHVAGGLAGDVPRVAGVVLVRDRILDVADHRQGRLRRERVDQRRLGLGDDQQVGLVDRASPRRSSRRTRCLPRTSPR